MNNIRKKIFMVDDDALILKIGKFMLKDHYDVFPMISAEKMFEALEKVKPDLILLDIMMPEVDGVETLRRLKADNRYEGIPVIFVSSIDDDKSVFEHLKLGAYSNVSKPFSSDELLNRIENCLNDYFPDKPPKREYSLDEDFLKSISAKKDAAGEEAEKELVPEKENVPEKEPVPDGYRPKILAVDDAPEVLRMVHLLLRDTYKVFTLSEPEKLAALLETLTPDLFLLDYKMPVMSGIDLIPVIREIPKHKNTPIIFLSSEKSPEFISEAVRLGACDFITKPMKAEIMKEKIAKHITK